MAAERNYKEELKAFLEEYGKTGREHAIPSLIAQCLAEAKFNNISTWDVLDCTAYNCQQMKRKLK